MIAAALAVVALLAIGAQSAGRPATALRLLLLPIAGFGVAAAYVAFRTASGDAAELHALRDSALAGVIVLSATALVVGTSSGMRSGAVPDRPLASRAGLAGALVLVLSLLAWWSVPRAWFAVVPSALGVVGVVLAARARSEDTEQRAARAAFEIVIVGVMALGAVALGAIAAASAALIDGHPLAAAKSALARAGALALPPLVAAAVVLARQLDAVGRGVVGRFGELGASIALVIAIAAALRWDLGRVLERAASPEPARELPAAAAEPPRASEPSAAPSAPASAKPPAADAAAAPVQADAGVDIRFGRVIVSGMLAPNEVRRGVERIRPRIEKCYQDARADARHGELTVKFSIAGSGSVSSVQPAGETSIGDRAFVDCIQAAFYMIGFPQPSRGHVRVELPIQIGVPLADGGSG